MPQKNIDTLKSILTATVDNEKPNYYVGPFADGIIEGLVATWCKDNPIPYDLDENDSWDWTIVEMHMFLKKLKGVR